MPVLARACLAEFAGTFALLLFGAGSVVMTHPDIGAGGLLSIALAHAAALIVFIHACFAVSGAQFNPAVSIALTLIGRQSPARTAAFVLTQLLAAACATGMLVLVLGPAIAQDPAVRVGATLGSLSTPDTALAALAIEALMTFILMFVILAAVDQPDGPRIVGFMVGLTVAACVVTFGPATGASLNPARSFGPALYGNWDIHWVYWLGPIAGAAGAATFYRFIWNPRLDEPRPHREPA